MTETKKTLRFGIAGSGSRSQDYARAISQVEGAKATATTSGRLGAELQKAIPGLALERDAGTLIKRRDVDALLLVDPVADAAAVIRRALIADKHVLATLFSPISNQQLKELAFLAHKHSCVLTFTEERSFQPAFVFLKWMLSGRGSLWRPRYLRAVATPGIGSGADVSLATLVIEQIGLCTRLLGENPTSVSGIVCRGAAEEAPTAAFINLIYPEGRAASLQISTVEAQESRQWTMATPGKTILLDECDMRSPLKIISFDSEAAPRGLVRVNPPIPLADWPTESTVTPPLNSTDVRVEQCRHFVQRALTGDLHDSSASFWAEVALAWEAVEESVRLSGMPVTVAAVSERDRKAVGERPKLRLIHGKGMGEADAHERPALTLVPR